MKKLGSLFILLLVGLRIGFSQELKVMEFIKSETDISAREIQVMDVNNEPCALIKVRTGLLNLEFESNLSIEKIDYQVGEYRIWVSPGTKRLKIRLNDFPLFEYELPQTTESYIVYQITIVAILPTQVVYRDKELPFVSFTSEPAGASLFLNGIYQGLTPLKINMPYNSYSFRVEKNNYLPSEGSDSLGSEMMGHNLKLEFDFKKRHFFVTPVLGLSSPPGGGPTDPSQASHTLYYGIKGGQLGRTGWYFSYLMSYKSIEPDIAIDQTRYKPLINISGYYYFSELRYDDQINHFSFTAGVTQQILKPLFVYAGAGYFVRDCYASAERRVFSEDYSIETQGIPKFQEAWVHMVDHSFRGMDIEGGIIVRIKRRFLLDIGISYQYEIDDGIIPRNWDLLIGLGYNIFK